MTGVNVSRRDGKEALKRLNQALVFHRLLWIVPFLAAAAGVLHSPDLVERNITGGFHVAVVSGSMLLFAPYIVLFIMALGTAVFHPRNNSLPPSDMLLLQFFCGASLATFIGVGLGAIGLLTPAVTLPIMVLVLAAYFAYPKTPSNLRAAFSIPTRRGVARWVLVALWSILVVTMIRFLLMEGLVPEGGADITQLYAPLLQEMQKTGSLWLNESSPRLFWFLLGRGRGVDMMMVSLGGSLAHQVVSVLYMAAIIGITYRWAYRLVPSTKQWADLRPILATSVALIAAASQLTSESTGRFHFETGAFIFFVAWAGFLMVIVPGGKTLFPGIALALVALSCMVPQAQAAVIGILVLVGIVGYLKVGRVALVRPALLAAIAAGSAALSLLWNWLYVGIPEVNPFAVFKHLVNGQRFEQFSSMELLTYVNNAQGITYAEPGLVGALSIVSRLPGEMIDSLPVVPNLALLVGIIAFVGLFVTLGPRQRECHTKPRRLFTVGLVLLVLALAAILAFTSHGSVERMLAFRAVLGPLLLVALAVAVSGRLAVRSFSRCTRNTATSLIVGGLAVGLAYVQQGSEMKARFLDTVTYISGQRDPETAARLLGGLSSRRCEEVSAHVPVGWVILPVNGALSFTPACAFSPFLPEGRVVETLYTPFNRDYGTVLIGPVDDAMEALKAQNINAFYVENNDLAFWAQGQSPLFDANSLRANFIALHEDPNYILLGWREGANGELTDEQIGRITDLRELSRQSSGVGSYYDGIRDLQAWREEN